MALVGVALAVAQRVGIWVAFNKRGFKGSFKSGMKGGIAGGIRVEL